jgi:iron(III) transport system ATP-binding protein
MATWLEVQNICMGFNGRSVVRNVSFVLKQGRIGCLLGPSGCGKTTLLRTIAGFETPSRGQILINGQVVSRKGWSLAPEKRRIGMVFQDLALFPDRCVRDNIAFGLRGDSRRAIRSRMAELLDLVGLSDVANAYPHELSGGQQQRVALARAMAPRPEILLLDEPFASLDPELRRQLASEIHDVLQQERVTSIVVTHDQYEAFALADEIGVIAAGEILQWDTGYNLYHRPASRFVADFIGQGVFLPGTVKNNGKIETQLGIVRGSLPPDYPPNCLVDVLIRPDDVIPDQTATTRLCVIDKVFQGPSFQYTLRLPDGSPLLCIAPSHCQHEIKERIGIRLDPKHLVVFQREIKPKEAM